LDECPHAAAQHTKVKSVHAPIVPIIEDGDADRARFVKVAPFT